MTSVHKAIIPVAGYGTRFLPLTKVVPKELIPLGNKPAIHYIVEEAIAAGAEEIILICNPGKTQVVDYFKPDKTLYDFLESKGKFDEIKELKALEELAEIKVAYQNEAMGLGHAVLCAREFIDPGENFLLILPDMLVFDETPAAKLLTEHCKDGDWGILLEKVPKAKLSSYGIIKGSYINSETLSLEGAVEKPDPNEAPSDLAILGRYLLPESIFALIENSSPGAQGEIQITDAINTLANKQKGVGVIHTGNLYDIGTPEGLHAAYQKFNI